MDDFKWFLGFLVIVIVFWFAGWTTLKKPPAPPGAKTATSAVESAPKSVAEKVTEAESTAKNLQEEIAKTKAAESTSVLENKVGIVSLVRGETPDEEYVVIQASYDNASPITITGLSIKSGITGVGHTLPSAWVLPFLNAQGEGEITALRPGERAYLISGRSPLPIASGRVPNTASFQLNRCTGFFEAGLDFSPPLMIECPAPTEEPLPQGPNTLSDACYDYLASIPRCTVPGSVPEHLQGDSSCQAHAANKVSYAQCVNYHKNEPDFYRGEWHMYLGRDTLLWRGRSDVVELRDAYGKLIDSQRF